MEYTPPTSRFATIQHGRLSRLGEFQFSSQPLPPVLEDAELAGAQQNQASFGTLPTQAVPILPSSRSYDQFLHPGGLEPPSTTLSCIPEDRRVTDQGEGHPGNPSVSHPGEPPAKKQRVECESCHETLGEHKTLTRHRETCREHCAKFGNSPKPFRCDECPQKSFSRKDVLRRHVQTIHRGQPRRRQQGSGGTAQQSSSDTAQESQGCEPQPQTIDITTIHYRKDSRFAFTGQNPTEHYANTVLHPDTNVTVAPVLTTFEHHTQTYSQAFTTSATVPHLQSSAYVAVSSEDDWSPDQDSTSYQDTPIEASSNGLTPATSKLSPASFVHEVATTTSREIDDDAELAADAALAAAVEHKLSLHDVPYLSAKPVLDGRNLRPRRIRNPTPCPLCGHEFGNGPKDEGEAERHLQRHMTQMKAIDSDTVSNLEANTCTDCQTHFLDVRDLKRHLRSAQGRQRCGLTFDHYEGTCTGHHPPIIEGRANQDHSRFKVFMREWERSQRVVYAEYVNDYANGTAPTNGPSYQEVPRLRAFENNAQAYKNGGYGSGRPACRRSTGSIYSMMSLKTFKSAYSTKSTPVRFRYGEMESDNSSAPENPVHFRRWFSKSFVDRKTPDITSKSPDDRERLVRWLAKAFADNRFHDITRMCSQGPPNFLHLVSEKRVFCQMRSSWFHSDLNLGRFRCLAAMVERGLNISESSVEHLTVAIDGRAADELLFAENSPLKAQSRLVQYAFLHAATRGYRRVVSKLLKSGILGTMSQMPDLDFIEGLHESTLLEGESPPDGIIARSSAELGPCALVLALSACQYRTASLFIEHGVAHYWGLLYLAARKSAVVSLLRELGRFHQRGEALPNHLNLLNQRLMDDDSMSLYAIQLSTWFPDVAL